jgi:hypothetical protein
MSCLSIRTPASPNQVNGALENHQDLRRTRDPVQSSWMNDQAGRTVQGEIQAKLYDGDTRIAGVGPCLGCSFRRL